jgi:molecular chaperone GrpE
VSRAELEAEQIRAAEYLEQAQRARAEFVNYRRRTEQEMQQIRQYAGERIVQRLLPTLDDLNRAIESMPEEERDRPWAQGVVLIQRKLWSILESEGVRPIDAVGQPFDPSRHEAVSVQEGANGATIVVDEYQRGYTLHDRVIRPSMVVVGSLESGEKRQATDNDE